MVNFKNLINNYILKEKIKILKYRQKERRKFLFIYYCRYI